MLLKAKLGLVKQHYNFEGDRPGGRHQKERPEVGIRQRANECLLKDISFEPLTLWLMLVAMAENVFPTRLAEFLVDAESQANETAPTEICTER